MKTEKEIKQEILDKWTCELDKNELEDLLQMYKTSIINFINEKWKQTITKF